MKDRCLKIKESKINDYLEILHIEESTLRTECCTKRELLSKIGVIQNENETEYIVKFGKHFVLYVNKLDTVLC